MLFFFFRAIDYIRIAWRILGSVGVSWKGGTPLFGLDGNVPLQCTGSGSWTPGFRVLDRNPLQECESWV